MTLELITNLIILLSSQFGFLYGVFTILIRKKPLYLKMVVLALACMMVSRIYVVLQFLTRGEMPGGFNVGLLGLLGCFLFLFSSNYGLIDGLADDGEPEFLKYRLISFVAPIIILAGFISMIYINDAGSTAYIYLIVVFFIAISSRYHFKHIIFPDVDFGVVRLIRGYNLIALLLCVCTTLWIVSYILKIDYMYLGLGICISVLCIIIIPVLKKEASGWTTV